jgi:hypothetical protein
MGRRAAISHLAACSTAGLQLRRSDRVNQSLDALELTAAGFVLLGRTKCIQAFGAGCRSSQRLQFLEKIRHLERVVSGGWGHPGAVQIGIVLGIARILSEQRSEAQTAAESLCVPVRSVRSGRALRSSVRASKKSQAGRSGMEARMSMELPHLDTRREASVPPNGNRSVSSNPRSTG